MQEWKQALWLAKFELKVSKRSFLFLFVFLIFMSLYFISSFSSYLANDFVGLDFFFILMFTVATVWTKPKWFQIQRINDGLLVAPSLIMLNQLPIKHDVIIKSRFIIFYMYSIPFQILLLISLYAFTPVLQNMTIGTYISFSIIWLSLSVYVGSIFAASEAGDKSTSTKTFVYGILLIVGALAIFTAFHLIFDYGIVHWTLIFAQKWPIPSTLISIILAVIGFKYWQRYMRKTMERIDYL